MGHDTKKLKFILESCKQGNRASQMRLYEHFYSYGMGICLRYSKSKEEAHEILNDGFLKVFKNLHQYDPEYPFTAWLRRIFINAAIDYHRKYRKYKIVLDSQPVPEPEPVYNDALSNLSFEELIKVIQKLPPAYQLVFNLFVVEGLKHHEIAERLNISIGASKSNLAKARKKLMGLLPKSERIRKTGER